MLMCTEKPALQSIQEFSDFRSEIMHEYSKSESMMAIQSMSSPEKPDQAHIQDPEEVSHPYNDVWLGKVHG